MKRNGTSLITRAALACLLGLSCVLPARAQDEDVFLVIGREVRPGVGTLALDIEKLKLVYAPLFEGGLIKEAYIGHNGLKYYLAVAGEMNGQVTTTAAPLATMDDPDHGTVIGFTYAMGTDVIVTCATKGCTNHDGCSLVFDSHGTPIDCSECEGEPCQKKIETLKPIIRDLLQLGIEVLRVIGTLGGK